MSTTLGQPADTTGVCTDGDNLIITPGGGRLVDTAATPNSATPPTLCGTLTGQHGKMVKVK